MAGTLSAQFRQDGVVLVRGALDAAACAEARRCFEWSLANPSPAAQSFYPEDGARFYQDLFNTLSWPHYRALVQTPALVEAIHAALDCTGLWFFFEQVFYKEGGSARRTPWHQDTSYFPIEGKDMVVAWTSLDPVAREDALEFVRGSHRGRLYNGSSFAAADDTEPLYDEALMERLPDIEANRAAFDIVGWAMEPGDLVLFHPSILHGGGRTRPGHRRRTLSLRYFGDDCRFVERPQVRGESGVGFNRGESDSRDISEFYEGLAPGSPFRHPDFLKVA